MEIIYHQRVRVVEHAAKTSVAEASRVFGVSRTTIHRWSNLAGAYGVDALMPKARRAPAMPNATPSAVSSSNCWPGRWCAQARPAMPARWAGVGL
jgi:hypothetical protein